MFRSYNKPINRSISGIKSKGLIESSPNKQNVLSMLISELMNARNCVRIPFPENAPVISVPRFTFNVIVFLKYNNKFMKDYL